MEASFNVVPVWTDIGSMQSVVFQVLGVPSVSKRSNFLALGGDSMAALRVCQLLAQRLRKKIEIFLRKKMEDNDQGYIDVSVKWHVISKWSKFDMWWQNWQVYPLASKSSSLSIFPWFIKVIFFKVQQETVSSSSSQILRGYRAGFWWKFAGAELCPGKLALSEKSYRKLCHCGGIWWWILGLMVA